jgi:aminopeptidase N
MPCTQARNGLRRFLAERLQRTAPVLRRRWRRRPYQPTPAAAGRRACATSAWATSANSRRPNASPGDAQFASADNMSDQFAALATLAQHDCRERARPWPPFTSAGRAKRWSWTSGCRCRRRAVYPDTLTVVQRLLSHPAFDLHNPNKVYALLNTFGNNHVRFHAADGSGYHFLAQQIGQLDPSTRRLPRAWHGASIAGASSTPGPPGHARSALESLRAIDGLSSDVLEIVGRALAERIQSRQPIPADTARAEHRPYWPNLMQIVLE